MEEIKKEDLAKVKAMFLVGVTGSGKTSLCFNLLSLFDKPVYFVRHPKPELLKPFGYNNLLSISEIEHLNNCVVYWDEPLTYLSDSDYKKNQILCKILSLARQRSITFIVSTSDSRTFLKGTEAFFDTWIVKDIEYHMTKQRSQIRKVIQDNCFISPDDFRLNVNEFLFYNRNLRELNGKHTFELAEGWTEELSTPYDLSGTVKTVKKHCKKELLNENEQQKQQKENIEVYEFQKTTPEPDSTSSLIPASKEFNETTTKLQ